MKGFLYFLIGLQIFVWQCLSAQSTSPMRFGSYWQRFANGQRQVDHYWNGKKSGLSVRYYSNGKVCIKSHYKKDILNGSYQSWYFSGLPAFSGTYKNSAKDGLWVYRRKNGTLKRTENYNKCIANGSWTYYKNDTIAEKEIIYKNGLAQKEIFYFPLKNRAIQKICFYKYYVDGNVEVDSVVTFFSNGKMSSSEWKGRFPYGIWWNEEGLKIRETRSYPGDSSTETFWYGNGSFKHYYRQKSGYHVLRQNYYENGLKQDEVVDEKGKLDYFRKWDNKGNLTEYSSKMIHRKWENNILIEETLYDKEDEGDHTVKSWFPNGQPQSFDRYESRMLVKELKWTVDGIKTIDITYNPLYEAFWYNNGSPKFISDSIPIKERELKNGKPLYDRFTKSWYANGNLQSEAYFKKDELKKKKDWDSVGRLQVVMDLSSGDLTEIHYWPNGKQQSYHHTKGSAMSEKYWDENGKLYAPVATVELPAPNINYMKFENYAVPVGGKEMLDKRILSRISEMNNMESFTWQAEENEVKLNKEIVAVFSISSDGSVTSIDIVQNIGPPFSENIKDALEHVKFIPKTLNGKKTEDVYTYKLKVDPEE